MNIKHLSEGSAILNFPGGTEGLLLVFDILELMCFVMDLFFLLRITRLLEFSGLVSFTAKSLFQFSFAIQLPTPNFVA
jgi:hypothetical protein